MKTQETIIRKWQSTGTKVPTLHDLLSVPVDFGPNFMYLWYHMLILTVGN